MALIIKNKRRLKYLLLITGILLFAANSFLIAPAYSEDAEETLETEKKSKKKPKIKVNPEEYEAAKEEQRALRDEYWEKTSEFRDKYGDYERQQYMEKLPSYMKSKYRAHLYGQLDAHDTNITFNMGKDQGSGWFRYYENEGKIAKFFRKYVPSTVFLTLQCNPTKINIPELAEAQDLFSRNHSLYDAPFMAKVTLGRNSSVKYKMKNPSKKEDEGVDEETANSPEYKSWKRRKEVSRTGYGMEVGYSDSEWADFTTDFFSLGFAVHSRTVSNKAFICCDGNKPRYGGRDVCVDFYWKYVNDNNDEYLDFYFGMKDIFGTYKDFYKVMKNSTSNDLFSFFLLLPLNAIPYVLPFISHGYTIYYRSKLRRPFNEGADNEKVFFFGPVLRVPWPLRKMPLIGQGYFNPLIGINSITFAPLFKVTFTIPFEIL